VRILLFGKNGQVGRELSRSLLPLGELIALGRNESDLEDLVGLNDILHNYRPDIIVNAAAYTAVDKAEDNEAAAYKINSAAVGVMASYASNSGAMLMHYSTDYVFDGKKSAAYVEADIANPLSVYGRSKRAGEEAIVQSGCNSLIFRTSWVFSAHGYNFIKTILRLAKERESINVVADQHGAPTSAELIADVTALAISRPRSKTLPYGVYHLTATGQTTWHGLACYVVSRALENGASLALQPQHVRAITTEDYPLPAKRPKNSCMNSGSLSSALGLHLPDWKIHVDRVVDQLTRLDACV